jgi:hypothetical protein
MFMCDMLRALKARLPWQQHFCTGSVWTALTINYGPQANTRDHCNGLNACSIPCSITGVGDYNLDEGSHLVLLDCSLVIWFPPGSVTHIISGCRHHTNWDAVPPFHHSAHGWRSVAFY